MLSSRSVSRRTLERAGLLVAVATLLGVLGSATLIDRRPPAVERISLSLTAGDPRVALTHSAIDVQFTEPVQRLSAQYRFRIAPAVEGTISWDGDRTLIFTPLAKLPVDARFIVRVEPGVVDLNGNVSDDAGPVFEFRTVGLPVVAGISPVDGAEDVPLDGPIRVTFDRLMDTELTPSGVRLEPTVPLRASWAGQTLTLAPTTPLEPATRYRVVVGDPAADTDGNRLSRSVSASFTTVATGLTVLKVIPADGAGGVPTTRTVAILFDQPLETSVSAGSIRITPPVSGQSRVVELPHDRPGASSPAAAPRPTVLQFVAGSPLAAHTTYTVQLLAGAVRAAGSNDVAAGKTWTFTTGRPPAGLQNQIVFLSDRNGIRNVWAMNPDGTNTRQVTSELAPVTSYDVSGDGRSLVYSSAGRVHHLWLPEGSIRTLTAEGDAEYGPRVVPDASAVAVGRRDRATGTDEGIWLLPLRPERGEPRPLLPTGAPPLGSSDASPAALASLHGTSAWAAVGLFSPDGRTALLRDGSGTLMRVDVATGASTHTGLREPAGPVSWAPREAAFFVVATRTRDAASGSWFVPQEAGPAYEGPGLAGWGSRNGRGATVGLSSSEPGRMELRASGRDRGTLLPGSTDLLDRQPSFAPGGGAVLFVRARRETPDVSIGIWLVRVDGGGARRLSADGTDPRWLP